MKFDWGIFLLNETWFLNGKVPKFYQPELKNQN